MKTPSRSAPVQQDYEVPEWRKKKSVSAIFRYNVTHHWFDCYQTIKVFHDCHKPVDCNIVKTVRDTSVSEDRKMAM